MSDENHLSRIERALAQTGGRVRGTELLNELASASGLPDDLIGHELSRLIVKAGKDSAEITLDELRDLLAQYLQEVLVEAKTSLAENEPPSTY